MPANPTQGLKADLRRLVAAKNHLAERFLAEVEFAEGLSRLHPTQAKRWAKRIEKACAAVGRAVASGKLDRLGKAVTEAEAILAPIGKAAKRYTIHCVGHGHIDMNWTWSWPETVAVTNDTFRTVLALMDEFPDFCYTQSQASVYAIMRDHHPDLLAEIGRRVAEGRWEIAASHWVEGDKNLAAGEALARHLLYARRFMKETFGLEPEDILIDWSPDTFGHAHTIPSIDARGAVRRYYLCRGGAFEKPPVFWWQGPDGSRILVNLETTWYNDHIGPHNAAAMLAFCETTGLVDWMNVYGVGDHGGGPTRRDILRARDMDTWPVYPSFRFATTHEFYAILEKHGDRWPVLERELNFEFTGCYTSQSAIKQANRHGENYCLEAETLAAVAARAVGRTYPAPMLRDAWTNVLFGHFHDILPGSGVAATRRYQRGLFQQTAAATGIIKTESLRSIAAAADTSFAGAAETPDTVPEDACTGFGGGAGRIPTFGAVTTAGHVADGPRAFLAFNPTAWPRTDVITATLWDVEDAYDPHTPDEQKRPFVVRAPDGRTVRAQRVDDGHYWGHRYVDLAVAAEIAGLGYTTFVVEEGEAPAPASGVTCGSGFRGGERQPVGDVTLENEFLTVGFDRETGGVVRLIDRTTGRDLACPDAPLAVLEYVLERPRGMTAWILGDPKSRCSPVAIDALGPGLTGPHVASIVAKAKVGDSDVTVTYALKAGKPELDITIEAHWVEIGRQDMGVPTLRMQFPFALTGAKARYEVPFGSIERDLTRGEEVPALRWADVSGKVAGGRARAGCTLLNDSKYGHSLDGSTLRLTLIRSTYDPDPLPEIGDHTIRLALVPHGKPLPVADLVRLGAGLNHPLAVVAADIHEGSLPPQAEGARVAPANVVVSSVRRAQDDDGIIIHLFETAGRETAAKVTLDEQMMGRPTEAVEVDLLERPIENSTAKAARRTVSVTVPPHGIAAVKINFT